VAKLKTSELTGALLDYWVAKAEGLDPCIVNDVDGIAQCTTGYFETFSPSTNWAQCGPIIDRERITILFHPEEWQASVGDYIPMLDNDPPHGTGTTPLIAAMRALVASKFGDEVPDEI
jgi:hypothetical protein